MTRPRLTLAAVLVLSLASAACSTGAEDTATTDEFSVAAEGLCRTADVVDDPTAAREIFYDTVHQALHQLADDTAAGDRTAAAGLLEAKQRVEATLDTREPSLAAAVDDLVDATSRALATLDRPEPDCETTR